MRVDIWSDVVCPWCYVGKARFEKALGEFPHSGEVEIVFRSFELDPGAQTGSETNLQMLSEKYGLPAAQARQAEERVAGLARAEGLGYDLERPVGNTFDLHRVIHLGKANGVQRQVLTAVNSAYFAGQRQVFDHGVLTEIATGAGLEAAAVTKVLDSDEYAGAVRGDEAQARALGISGVPFFAFDMALGLSGAQPIATFSQALTQAWERRRGNTSS